MILIVIVACGRRAAWSSWKMELRESRRVRCHGVLERDDMDLLAHAQYIQGVDNLDEPLDVGLDVGDDEHPRGRVGQDDACLRHERVEDLFHVVGAGVLQRHDLGDHAVIGADALGSQPRLDALLPRLLARERS